MTTSRGGFLGVGKEGGRPPHMPTDQTRRLVEMMSGLGVPQMHVALSIGISDETRGSKPKPSKFLEFCKFNGLGFLA